MIQITDGITIVIRKPRKVNLKYDVWRIDITFYSLKPSVAKIRTNYELWATDVFMEDFLHIRNGPSEKQMKEFGLEFIRKRLVESKENLPDEYGAFCSNMTGIKLVNQNGTLMSYFEKFILVKSKEN